MSVSDPAERVEGVVTASDAPFGWVEATLEVRRDGETVHRAAYRVPFAVETSDGDAVEIDARDARIEGAKEKSRGKWSELARDRLGMMLGGGFRAGPDAHLEIVATGLRVGEAVVVKGRATRHRSVDGRGYREGAPRRVSAVEASEVSSAAAGDGQRAPRSPYLDPLSDLVPLASVLGGLALALAAMFAPPWPGTLVAACLRGSWVAFGLSGALYALERWLGHPHVYPSVARHHPLPQVATHEGTETAHARFTYVPLLLAGVVVIFSLPEAEYLEGSGERDTNLLWFGALVAWLATALLIVSRLANPSLRRARRILGTLAHAPRRRADREGFQRVEGRLRSPLVREVRVVRKVRASFQRTPVADLEQRWEIAEPLEVETADGTIEIAPIGVDYALGHPARRRDGERRTFRFEAEPGDAVWVAGYFEPGGRTLRAQGPESVIVSTVEPRFTLALARLLIGPALGALATLALLALTGAIG